MIKDYSTNEEGHNHFYNLCAICTKTHILGVGYGKTVCEIALMGTEEYVHHMTEKDKDWICPNLIREPMGIYIKCPKCLHLEKVNPKDLPYYISCNRCKKVFDNPFG